MGVIEVMPCTVSTVVAGEPAVPVGSRLLTMALTMALESETMVQAAEVVGVVHGESVVLPSATSAPLAIVAAPPPPPAAELQSLPLVSIVMGNGKPATYVVARVPQLLTTIALPTPCA